MRAAHAQGLRPARGLEHVVPALGQDLVQQAAHGVFVLDEEDRLFSRGRGRSAGTGAAAGVSTSTSGSQMRKVVPWPGALSTATCPPLCLTIP